MNTVAIVIETPRRSVGDVLDAIAEVPVARLQIMRLCANGHLIGPDLTYVDPRGTHRCRRCAREHQRLWRAGRRA